MSYRSYRRALLGASAGLCLLSAAAAAESPAYTTPHTTNAAGAESASIGGQTFTNQGLVGTGRLSAMTRDFLGDTLGSFSGMWVNRESWRRNGDSYSGWMFTLPDRGRNDPAANLFYDYTGRLIQHDFVFTPYSGAPLPASTASQDQMVYTPTGDGMILTDFNGNRTTGADPGAGLQTQNGYQLPSPVSGTGAGKISLDAEAVAFLPDGSFYVGDEYTGGVYYFDKTGKMQGFLTPTEALLPVTGGNLNYNSLTPPTTGRRNNQGIEGLSLSPDGKTLFAVLQSATVQDTQNANQANRTNTRILVYDITGNRAPSDPVAHYVLQLPTFTLAGDGSDVNRTAAQSEILALNDRQLLVLSRDGIGQGVDAEQGAVYKSILLVDLAGATNIAGTGYETGTTPVDTLVGGKVQLDPAITPVSYVEVVNMLNPTQLATFGMNIKSTTSSTDPLTISEKLESMALMPTLDEAHPQDFFLFVGNDNDFATTDGSMDGESYDSGFNNDNMFLVYHLTLPTAVDPLFYQYMVDAGSVTAASAGEAALSQGEAAQQVALDRLRVLRTAVANNGPLLGGVNAWAGGDALLGNKDNGDFDTDQNGFSGALGADLPVAEGLVVGGAINFSTGETNPGDGFETDGDAIGLTLYGQYMPIEGLFLSASYSFLPWVSVDTTRPGAYGLEAQGDTTGLGQAAFGEIAYLADLGGVKAGPVGNVTYVWSKLDGYTESGAAGGNIKYEDRTLDRTSFGLGGEVTAPVLGFDLTGRAGYNFVLADDEDTTLRLASVQGGFGGETVSLPALDSDYVNVGFGVQGSIGFRYGWYAGYEAQIGIDGGVANLVNAGLNVHF